MSKKISFSAIIGVILIGVIFQVLLCLADAKDTPDRAAVEFAKAYFKLDSKMSDMLCGDKSMDVNRYLEHVAKEARTRGFGINFMKYAFYNISTKTVNKDSKKATIRLTGKKRICVNPLYVFVARIFDIGQTYDVDEVIELVNEDGLWKVCNSPFSLT